MRGKWAARDWAVLELLGCCAVDGSGWRLGGVYGWLLYEDVDAALCVRVSEALPHLAALGLAQRRDVRAPGRRRPMWAYRVTDAGLRLLAEHEDTEPRSLRPVRESRTDAGTFFLPRRLWRSFAALQARASAGEMGGWMSLRQLASARARLDSADADWLIRAGLVERQRDAAEGFAGTWYFRVTAAGLRVERTAPYSPFWARVRLREPDPPR